MTVSDSEPAELSALLADHDDEVAASTRRLRAAILAARPELAEKVYRGWHGLGFHHPELGYVAALFPREQGVQVGFEHGANLPDPHGMLSGTGRQVRYLIFTPGAATPSVEDVVESWTSPSAREVPRPPARRTRLCRSWDVAVR